MNIPFAQQLRVIRLKRGYEQREVARLCGLPSSQISHFETGQRLPSVQNLCKLAAALEVSTDYLLGRTAEEGMTYTENRRIQQVLKACEALRGDQVEILWIIIQLMKGEKHG